MVESLLYTHYEGRNVDLYHIFDDTLQGLREDYAEAPSYTVSYQFDSTLNIPRGYEVKSTHIYVSKGNVRNDKYAVRWIIVHDNTIHPIIFDSEDIARNSNTQTLYETYNAAKQNLMHTNEVIDGIERVMIQLKLKKKTYEPNQRPRDMNHLRPYDIDPIWHTALYKFKNVDLYHIFYYTPSTIAMVAGYERVFNIPPNFSKTLNIPDGYEIKGLHVSVLRGDRNNTSYVVRWLIIDDKIQPRIYDLEEMNTPEQSFLTYFEAIQHIDSGSMPTNIEIKNYKRDCEERILIHVGLNEIDTWM